MPNQSPLAYGEVYHIYNRGNNGDDIFLEPRNYPYFLQRYAGYIEPVAQTYAYCLLKNHFHALIRTRTPEEQQIYHTQHAEKSTPFTPQPPSRQFARLFGAYAMAINKTCGRTGSLFEHPFHRRRVTSDAHYRELIIYIHRNPQHHSFVTDFRDWPHTSYRTVLSSRPTRLQRAAILEWFGGTEAFVAAHKTITQYTDQGSLLLE